MSGKKTLINGTKVTIARVGNGEWGGVKGTCHV